MSRPHHHYYQEEEILCLSLDFWKIRVLGLVFNVCASLSFQNTPDHYELAADDWISSLLQILKNFVGISLRLAECSLYPALGLILWPWLWQIQTEDSSKYSGCLREVGHLPRGPHAWVHFRASCACVKQGQLPSLFWASHLSLKGNACRPRASLGSGSDETRDLS